MPYLYYFFITIAIVYLIVLFGIYYFQRHLLFHPEGVLEAPQHYGLNDLKLHTLTTPDSIKITSWYKPPSSPFEPVLLYFHGNRGHIGDRADKLALFSNHMAVLAISYRGFGTSHGTPSEQGLYHDARAAIQHLLHANPDQRIVLYGESLGTGVAVQMATEFNIGAVILEAPYTSIAARGAAKYPYIPVNHLLKDRFDSLSKMQKITAPLLILHGEHDDTIPVTDGKKLFAAANHPKELMIFPNTNHTDFDLHEITRLSMNFISSSLKK